MGKSFVENRLITEIAAAGGLHRRLLPDSKHVSPVEFEVMQAALIEVVSPRTCGLARESAPERAESQATNDADC
jgi:hypothetical protein